MNLPAVSVLMPVYNAERYVGEAVESILGQTFSDFEFIIIDDGSTDGSLGILRKYADRDGRIRLVSRPNTGYVVALNEAISLARGEYLARMDADDASLPERFQAQVDYLKKHPECVAVGTRVVVVDSDGDPLGEWNRDETHEVIDAAHMEGSRGGVICHPSVMMRRSAVRAVGGYHAEHETAEDLDLWLRLAEIGRLANLPEALLRYRMHPKSVSHARSEQQWRTVTEVLRDAYRRRGLDASGVSPTAPGNPIGAAHLHRKWAWWALGAGHVSTARKHALRCAIRGPWSMMNWKVLLCAIRGY